ncbi:putative RNA-directed DNA polymerase from transposon BS, partial [Diplonema papillatum]
MDDNVIIAGDLNAHHPDWSTGAENVGGRILRDWLLETSAITWNDPTVSTMVHRSHARYSSPDVVISTPTPGNILNWRPLASWGSDHLPIAFEVPRGYSQPRVPRLSWFSWRRADWDGMMEYLDEESSALLGKRPATNTQFAKRVASTFRRAIHQFWVPRCRPSSDDAGCGPITAAELDRALSNLDAKTSLDPDGLCCEFLRRLTGSATDLVLELLNISWEEGFVPDSWHNAHVVPVQKPGRDRSLPEGYRPISLTSIISKLMEVIVKNRLEFLTESPDYPQILPFCARQGGFRKGRGTEEQLFSVVSALDWAKTRLQHFCLLSFDLANAFDTVDHQRLLCILERRGIPAKFLRWIEAFLRNRKAAYKLDGATGRYFDLKTGVPQGTVLGPLLFLYYINDLGTELEQLRRHIHQDNVGASITFSLYADDDGVAVEARTFAALERYTQDVVDVVERWTENALMVLSKRKTKAGHQSPDVLRRLVSEERKIVGLGAPHDGKTVVSVVRKASGGTLLRVVEELQWVDSVRLLGLTIDRELTFHPHLRRVIEVFSLRLNFLRHLAGKDYCFNGTILRTLYLTYVLPTFTYALGIYGPYILFAAGLLATLGRLHRRALALILGCRKGTSDFAAQQESGILPIRSLVEYKIAALRERLRHNRALWMRELSLDTRLRTTYDRVTVKAGTDQCIRQARIPNRFAPWTPCPGVTINTALKVRKNASAAEKKRAAEVQLATLPHPHCTAWSDGSVVSGDPPPPSICDANASATLRSWLRSTNDRSTWGGSGLYIELEPSVPIKADHGLGQHLTTPTGNCRTVEAGFPAGRHPHSYRAEEMALVICVNVLKRLLPPSTTPLNILIVSDSQSLLQTLSHGPLCQTQPGPIHIWQSLAELEARGYTITLQFVFGHCGLSGNERADGIARRAAEKYMREAVAATARNLPLPYAPRVCTTTVNARHRAVLWMESSEAGAREAVSRAARLQNPSSFSRLVFGRRIPRPKHLTPRAEREVRQIRTGHHHLVMTMYATNWPTLTRADRREPHLPCPMCGTRSLAPLVHLFIGCDAPVVQTPRLEMKNGLEVRNRLGRRSPPVDAMEFLWAVGGACAFKCTAMLHADTETYHVSRADAHSCVFTTGSGDEKANELGRLHSEWVTRRIAAHVEAEPDLSVKGIVASMRTNGVTITSKVARLAKAQALQETGLDAASGFRKLRACFAAVKCVDAEAVTSIDTKPGVATEEDANPWDVFGFAFLAFGACVHAARSAMFVSVDGTHLTHGGVLFVAVVLDPMQKVVPIAYALGQTEDTASWTSFLVQLKELLPEGFTLMSDRDKGLMSAVKTVLPTTLHLICVNHVVRNVSKSFGKGTQHHVWKLAHASSHESYAKILAIVSKENDDLACYLDKLRDCMSDAYLVGGC